MPPADTSGGQEAELNIDYLVYVSQAAPDLSQADIERILETSRRYNTDKDITGMLLFVEERDGMRGSFMQLLEGNGDELKTLRNKIFDDPRHHTKIVIEQGHKAARDFGDWSMAYKSADSSALADSASLAELGQNEFFERCTNGEISVASEFLIEFWNADD